jgi:hypothetical protein
VTAVLREAPDGMALDASIPITPALAQKMAATPLLGQKLLGVSQYVGLEQNSSSDISAANLQGIMAANLGLWLTQHCLYPGWVADGALGHKLGASARQNAASVGYLNGCHLALDLEGCKSVGQDVIDYVNAWVNEVRDDYQPLLYVGYSCGLTAQQLYEAFAGIHCYWSDFGPRQVSTRGFAIKQHAQVMFCGQPVDPDELQEDHLGGRLRWMIDDGN